MGDERWFSKGGVLKLFYFIPLQLFHEFKAPLQLIVSLAIVSVIIPFVFGGAQGLFDSRQAD